MIDARRLWLAVLVQAINDLAHTDERQRLRRHFTRLWFISGNHNPGSFHWICDHLDLDASWFRRRLFAIVDAPVSKHLHSSMVRQFENRQKGVSPGQTASTIAPRLTISLSP